MQKDDLVYIGHMVDLAHSALSKVADKSRSEFDADENLRLALTHLLQNLGEAARRVSPEFQEAHPQVPWKEIIGMRHRVVHDYLHVNFQIVWTVATIDLPAVLPELERIAPPEPLDSL